MREVVLATTSRHKLAELRAMLSDLPLRIVGLGELPLALGYAPPEETGATFRENADLKARHAARATGRVAIADDSGLEVDALGGRPGVRSARFAGDGASDLENNRKLVAEARAAGLAEPRARFRCVLSVAAPDGEVLCRGEGACEGVLVEQPRGAGGFGYDPHFLVPALGRTFAELDPAEKNRVSHRARALADLRGRLLPALSEGSAP